jgi:hypothetical protein
MFGIKIGIEIEDHIELKSLQEILKARKILLRRIPDIPEKRKMFIYIRIHANQRGCASLVNVADLDLRKSIFYRSDEGLTDHGIAYIDIRYDQDFFHAIDQEKFLCVSFLEMSIKIVAKGKPLDYTVYDGA